MDKDIERALKKELGITPVKQTVTEKQRANLLGGEFFKTLPPERLREISSMGGKACQEKRRKIKRMTEAAKWLLSCRDMLSDDDIKDILIKMGITDATNAEALMMVAMRKAYKGDIEALKFVRDTGGESPSNRVELTGDLDRPVATLDLRNMSEEELLRLAEAKREENDEDVAETDSSDEV